MTLIKSISEIINDLIAGVSQKTPFTNFNPSAAIRNLLEVIAAPIAELYQLVQTVTSQAWIQTATGEWLDLKTQEVGIVRNPAVKAQIYLTFSKNSPAAQNITIPANTICKTLKDAQGQEFRFYTMEEGILEQGQSEAVVLSEAEEAGAAYNVGPETITKIVTAVSGIDAVTNIDISEHQGYLKREGSDPESDEQLRQRAIGVWETLGLGGDRTAYQTWALSVPGVVAATVLDDFPFGPGTVGVVIVGADGAPTPQLLNEVYQYIKIRKPLTADVRILGPEITSVDLSLEVTRFANADPQTIEADILAAVENFASNLQLGEGLILSRLINHLMEVDGVYNVKILLPEKDVLAPVSCFLQIGEVEITQKIKGRTYQDGGIPGGSGGDETTAGTAIPNVNQQNFGIGE
jgi:uncharacterized phage protein gp47/JayE